MKEEIWKRGERSVSSSQPKREKGGSMRCHSAGFRSRVCRSNDVDQITLKPTEAPLGSCLDPTAHVLASSQRNSSLKRKTTGHGLGAASWLRQAMPGLLYLSQSALGDISHPMGITMKYKQESKPRSLTYKHLLHFLILTTTSPP